MHQYLSNVSKLSLQDISQEAGPELGGKLFVQHDWRESQDLPPFRLCTNLQCLQESTWILGESLLFLQVYKVCILGDLSRRIFERMDSQIYSCKFTKFVFSEICPGESLRKWIPRSILESLQSLYSRRFVRENLWENGFSDLFLQVYKVCILGDLSGRIFERMDSQIYSCKFTKFVFSEICPGESLREWIPRSILESLQSLYSRRFVRENLWENGFPDLFLKVYKVCILGDLSGRIFERIDCQIYSCKFTKFVFSEICPGKSLRKWIPRYILASLQSLPESTWILGDLSLGESLGKWILRSILAETLTLGS